MTGEGCLAALLHCDGEPYCHASPLPCRTLPPLLCRILPPLSSRGLTAGTTQTVNLEKWIPACAGMTGEGCLAALVSLGILRLDSALNNYYYFLNFTQAIGGAACPMPYLSIAVSHSPSIVIPHSLY